MGAYLSPLISQLLVCLIGLTICLATQFQAQAADGDIIISRDVQPRSAIRQELVPDPNPQLVNPNRQSQINSSLSTGKRALEISDNEFAGVHSGSSPIQGLHIFPQSLNQSTGAQSPGRGVIGNTGNNTTGRAVGGAVRAGDQVNRSVQQGLRPLQNLKGN